MKSENPLKMRKNKIIPAAAGLLMIALCYGCGHTSETHDHDAHGHEMHETGNSDEGHSDEGHSDEGHSDEIVFEAAKAAQAGVRSDTVKAGPFREVIRTSGKIIPATGNETAVIAGRSGIVSFGNPLAEGSPVNKEDVLFTISSGNMQDGDPAQKAYITYQTALKEYERAKILVQDDIVSRQQFEAVKSNYETAKLAYDAIAGGKDGGTPVKAPSSGYAGNISVKDGDYVTAGQVLMSIVSHDRMYLQADLSGKYIDRLDKITTANFVLPYSDKTYGIEELAGRIVAKGRMIDENSAYLPVTFEFEGNRSIIPGTFAETYLMAEGRDCVISIPLKALIEEQGEYYVFRRLDEDCYSKVHVTIGASDGERIEITSGIEDGDVIVTEGAMRIKLASAANTIPGHTHNH